MSAGTVVEVDPKTLLVGTNVRKDVQLTKEFLGSVKERGVVIPIVAYESPDGLVVLEGQRRTLAAVDLGLESVPVYVRDAPTEAERIVDQVVANEHRADLTETEAIAAVQELTLFEMKAPAIAKQMGLPRQFVDKAVSVGGSKAASAAMVDRQLSFDTAVLIASFDEFPEQQAKLLELKQEWQIRDAAEDMRRTHQVAEVEEQIKALDGVTLIKDPGHSASDPLPIRHLYVDEKKTTSLEDVPHEQMVKLAGDGLCAYAGFEWVERAHVPVVKYAVKGWAARGLHTHSYYASGPAKPTTPEEVEAAKAERREARESTKAWVAASVERMRFLQKLVTGKSMPKGWEPLVTSRLLDHNSPATTGWRATIAILGLKESEDAHSLRQVVVKYLEKNPAAALKIALAAYLGAVEGAFEFERKGWSHAGTPAYLKLLQGWGYELSEIEQSIVKAGK